MTDETNLPEPETPELDPSVQANTTAQRIQKSLRWMIIATVVLYLGLGVIALYGFNISAKNTKGLCALRDDAQGRVDTSKAFLKENPTGVEGISKEQLLRSIDNSRRTVHALQDIQCPLPEVLAPLTQP